MENWFSVTILKTCWKTLVGFKSLFDWLVHDLKKNLNIIGKSERTKTDKKRERRKKKLKQKLHVKKTINKNMLTDKKSKKHNFSQGNNMQKVCNFEILYLRNIHLTFLYSIYLTFQMKETLDKKSFKSSTAFFTQLQEQVQSSIKEKMSKKSSIHNNKQLSAKKLKL